MSSFLAFVFIVSLVGCGRDSDKKNSSSPAVSTPAFKIIRATPGVYNPDFGATPTQAITAADLICDGLYPGHKALLGSSARYPDVAGSGALDWVLEPNTEYRRADGVTVIGTTTSNAVFTFNLTNSFTAGGGDFKTVWTGLSANWSVNANTCINWTSNVFSNSGRHGWSDNNNSNVISANNTGCAAQRSLYCVEQ